jgi:hypothetical protein
MATAYNTDDTASRSTALAANMLKAAGVFWFLIAVTGQFLFAVYILVFYGGHATTGNLEPVNKELIEGFIAHDLIGNLVLAGHLLFAFIITVGGPIQLVPRIRDRAPRFHHWNGRIYLLAAVIMSFGGLYMVWVRNTWVGPFNQIAISIDALLILAFAAMAVRHAIARNIDTHRRFALRLFLVVNAVWFMRVGYMAWAILNQGPVGMSDKLDGPFDFFISFACYLVPLAVLEIYLRAQDRAGAGGKFAMAAALVALTALMGLGIFGAFNAMWLPHLKLA